MLPKYIRALKILEAGRELEMPDGFTLVMSEANTLCYKMQRVYPEPADVYLEADISINHFIQLCEDLKDDYLFIKGAETVLHWGD